MSLPTSKYFTLQQLTEGVYAAIDTGNGAAANAGIIDLGDRTLVFDTFMVPAAADDLRSAAERLLGRPVAIVVNSHVDQDHVFGNQVFPGAVICATEQTSEAFARHPAELKAELERLEAELAATADQTALARKRERYEALSAVRLTPPTLTFRESIEFHGSARRAQLFTYGGGHSVSDSLLYLPADRILFTGDLVTVGHHPYLAAGDHRQWLAILDRVDHLAVDRLVPGHGPVGSMADLRAIRAYIADLQGAALAGVEADVPPAYAHWAWPFLYRVNRRAVAGLS
jgi:cyclase